jgi:Tol biopolymer transport system component
VDKRTDVWAFGCVVFEMLTGHAAFGGRTPSDAIAAVLEREPDFSRLPTATPPRVRWLLQRCLAKDRDRRLRDIGDARLEIADPREAGDARPPASARAGLPAARRWGWAAAAAAAGAVLALAVAPWLRPSPVASPRLEPGEPLAAAAGLTRVTFDAGYVEAPTLSPDGRLVAFASDRGGQDNLDIWLQHVAGGDPIQLTRSADEERLPSFSADGGQILFRSEAGRGGLYTVPTLGGVPRLVVEGGIGGRYSPDGRLIAYWTGSQIGFTAGARSYRTFVMPAGGGTSRELEGFTGARFPVWSPDSRFIMVAASRAEVPEAETYDWWVVRPESGDAGPTGAARAFRAAAATELVPAPSAWAGDRLVATVGGQLWSASLGSAPDFSVAGVQRVTFGPGDASQPAASAGGLVAFVGSTSSQNLWAMPLDTETAVVRGEPRQLTQGAGPNARGMFSSDEAQLAFQAYRGKWTILVRDMASGRTADLSLPARPFGPVLSPDGTQVVFPHEDGGASVVATQGGPLRRLCDDCEPGEWVPDGRSVAAAVRIEGVPRVMSIDVATGQSRPLLGGSDVTNRPHFSRDGRWLAFRTTRQTTGSQVFVAPFDSARAADPSTWVSISDARERDARPAGWSPGGRMIYFLSSRDGFRCLYARPWNAPAGRPDGPIQLVRHFHNFRNPSGGGASVISTGAGSAIASGQFVFDYSTTTGDVWMLSLHGAER